MNTQTELQSQIVAAVKAHAIEHYCAGWDAVVECWETADILQHTKEARTVAEAISLIGEIVDIQNIFANEIRAEADL